MARNSMDIRQAALGTTVTWTNAALAIVLAYVVERRLESAAALTVLVAAVALGALRALSARARPRSDARDGERYLEKPFEPEELGRLLAELDARAL